uniref:Uncharacterized protein n=1 Tax=Zea mays TaxID=4577 RepID=A0A804LVM8_MAIZE
MTRLHSRSSLPEAAAALLPAFLSCFRAFLARRTYDWTLAWTLASSLLLRPASRSWTAAFSSARLSCVALQRSMRSRERSISASSSFRCCWTVQAWLLGRWTISSMCPYTSPSLVRPSRTAATVEEEEEEEGGEAASSRLCSSASTSASLVRLLDGRLTDLWWKAIVCDRTSFEVSRLKPLS